MVAFKIEAGSSTPLVEQIVAEVSARIADKSLRAGSRLPSIRKFAVDHGVSKFTVVEAYDRLVARGQVQSRPGAGFFVAQPTEVRKALSEARAEQPLKRVLSSLWLLRQDAGSDESELIRAGCGWLPPEWLPEDEIGRALRELTRRPNHRLTRYGDPAGYLPLRQLLSLRLAEIGLNHRPDHIVLTVGAMHAIDLISRYLVRDGDVVFVDTPGFFNVFANQKLHGSKLVGVPRTKEGPDLDELEALLIQHRPRLFITQSVLHNPTGTSLSKQVAEGILALAEKYDFLIVEDDLYGDFQCGPGERLAALDEHDRVIYIGGFSKSLSANLRVGFIATSAQRAQDLCDLKLVTGMSSPEVSERVVHSMLVDGSYRKHVERVQDRLQLCARRYVPRLEALGFQFWAPYQGGMFVYVRRPDIFDTAPLAKLAMESGVMLAPGVLFTPDSTTTPWLRLNLAYLDKERVWDVLEHCISAVQMEAA
ncbi:PLP-dependent aminotransferase family protein [Burkholderiaceae bacterium DAT-1]|nr:PLP-dependent aminotransferase family protein [Burkholderiaceae bacterium DAT-1]